MSIYIPCGIQMWSNARHSVTEGHMGVNCIYVKNNRIILCINM